MNNGDILMTMTNGLEQANGDYKKILYARATHSNHIIQYHMQQIMERQKVVDKYRSMMVDVMDLTPLEVIQQSFHTSSHDRSRQFEA